MNPCGDCTACCDSMGFTHKNPYTVTHPDIIASLPVVKAEGISYDWGQPCNKLCSNTGDCTIYERRPYVCSSFDCAYRRYDIGDHTRPDRLGFIVDADDPGLDDGWVMITPWLHGQKQIDAKVWQPQNHDRIVQVLEDLSFETNREFHGYLLQCSYQYYNEDIPYEVFRLH